MASSEAKRIGRVYQGRREKGWGARYSLFQKGALQQIQERERVLLRILKKTTGASVADKRVLDIGCGSGDTLLPMLFYGFQPENCFGIDLLEDRIAEARVRLPNMTFACCSAEQIPFEKGSFDLVTMFTCLAMVLDKQIRATICQQTLEMLKPGGWVLIYDMRVNNPSYEHVRSVSLRELRGYFSSLKFYSETLTLIPPLGRFIGRCSMTLCSILALIPFLRTHRISVFQKPYK
jgi:ubiquinone/menaquinone biosynthesis C-methylase UbiE